MTQPPFSLAELIGVGIEWRNGTAGRVKAAGMLILAALDDVRRATATDVADEVHRRELELQLRAVSHAVADLAGAVVRMRVAFPFGACAHCGWTKPPTKSGICARCSRLRAVPDEREKRMPMPGARHGRGDPK